MSSSIVANGEEIEWNSQFSLGKGFGKSNFNATGSGNGNGGTFEDHISQLSSQIVQEVQRVYQKTQRVKGVGVSNLQFHFVES